MGISRTIDNREAKPQPQKSSSSLSKHRTSGSSSQSRIQTVQNMDQKRVPSKQKAPRTSRADVPFHENSAVGHHLSTT